MKPLVLLEWAAEHADEAQKLIDEFDAIPVPAPGHFQEFVTALTPFELHVAAIADTFPVDALKACKPAQELKRKRAARNKLKTFGDGQLLKKFEQILPVVMQAWKLWQQFQGA